MSRASRSVANPQFKSGGFRAQLRQDTHPRHIRIEAAFDTLDITRRDDLRIFLEAHALALTGLPDILDPDWPYWAGEVRRLSSALRDDIAAVGGSDPAGLAGNLMAGFPVPPHPLGISYVIAGSRLGSQILAKRLRDHQEPDSGLMSKYLSHSLQPDAWPNLCAALEMISTNDEQAAVSGSAAFMFDRFENALTIIRQKYCE